MSPRLALKLLSCCLSLPSAQITCRHHHTWEYFLFILFFWYDIWFKIYAIMFNFVNYKLHHVWISSYHLNFWFEFNSMKLIWFQFYFCYLIAAPYSNLLLLIWVTFFNHLLCIVYTWDFFSSCSSNIWLLFSLIYSVNAIILTNSVSFIFMDINRKINFSYFPTVMLLLFLNFYVYYFFLCGDLKAFKLVFSHSILYRLLVQFLIKE
jgi:hypothetical protein